MKNKMNKVAVVSLIIVVVVVALFFLNKSQTGGEKVSRFGKYQGYSERSTTATSAVLTT